VSLLNKFKSGRTDGSEEKHEIKAQPKKKQQRFAMVPIDWAVQASDALRCPRAMFLIWLCHLAWREQRRGEAFPVSTRQLEQMGVSRFVKRGSLYALETRGLVEVTRQRGKAPTVRPIGSWWKQ
jgi:hypothetical protein